MSNTQNTETKDPSVNRLVDDVRTMGHELKSQARDAKEVVVRSAKEIAADTRRVAQAKFETAREHLRAKSHEVSLATDAHLETSRQQIVAQPLKSIAIAAGVGYLLGRFFFNGR
jgi:ElaB/YqjD/DUF883 family membrane-anchored ribosome-binding protein